MVKTIEVSERFDALLPHEKNNMIEMYYKMTAQYKTKTQIMLFLGLTNYEFKKFRKVFIDPEEEALYTIHKDIIEIACQYGVCTSQLKERLAEGLGVYTSATYPPEFSIEEIKACEQ